MALILIQVILDPVLHGKILEAISSKTGTDRLSVNDMIHSRLGTLSVPVWERFQIVPEQKCPCSDLV